jgi:hypothetical protein
MCCNNLAFLKALQSCGRASDDRERREMTELRKAARRGVAAFFMIQVSRLWRTVLSLQNWKSRDQAVSH